MQTLLPHASFRYSAIALGHHLIAYQKSDCIQVLRYISTKQDHNTAVFNVWKNHYPALYEYCHTVFDVFDSIYYVDKHCRLLLPERNPNCPMPPWFGNMDIHNGHKGYLAKRYPGFFPQWRNHAPRLYFVGAGL